MILGNVHSETLYRMFHGQRLLDFQRMQLQGRRFQDSKCAACCAPDDVAHPLDALDDDADCILKRLEEQKL